MECVVFICCRLLWSIRFISRNNFCETHSARCYRTVALIMWHFFFSLSSCPYKHIHRQQDNSCVVASHCVTGDFHLFSWLLLLSMFIIFLFGLLLIRHTCEIGINIDGSNEEEWASQWKLADDKKRKHTSDHRKGKSSGDINVRNHFLLLRK